MEEFLNNRVHFLTGNISHDFMEEMVALYANAVQQKTDAMDHRVGFIDGTVIEVARTGDNEAHNDAYNGYKRKQAMKFQSITTLDSLIIHAFGPA